jgi:hypothetical protein
MNSHVSVGRQAGVFAGYLWSYGSWRPQSQTSLRGDSYMCTGPSAKIRREQMWNERRGRF